MTELDPAIRTCLEEHLASYVKIDKTLNGDAWLAKARRHLESAGRIAGSDPSGSLMLTWSALHASANAATARVTARLDGESHGAVARFLGCVFGDLGPRARPLIKVIQETRNKVAYDDPNAVDVELVKAALGLATAVVNRLSAAPTD